MIMLDRGRQLGPLVSLHDGVLDHAHENRAPIHTSAFPRPVLAEEVGDELSHVRLGVVQVYEVASTGTYPPYQGEKRLGVGRQQCLGYTGGNEVLQEHLRAV